MRRPIAAGSVSLAAITISFLAACTGGPPHPEKWVAFETPEYVHSGDRIRIASNYISTISIQNKISGENRIIRLENATMSLTLSAEILPGFDNESQKAQGYQLRAEDSSVNETTGVKVVPGTDVILPPTIPFTSVSSRSTAEIENSIISSLISGWQISSSSIEGPNSQGGIDKFTVYGIFGRCLDPKTDQILVPNELDLEFRTGDMPSLISMGLR